MGGVRRGLDPLNLHKFWQLASPMRAQTGAPVQETKPAARRGTCQERKTQVTVRRVSRRCGPSGARAPRRNLGRRANVLQEELQGAP
jgi:hypothetical protein